MKPDLFSFPSLRAGAVLALSAALHLATPSAQAARLPGLDAQLTDVSVSGLSSGGYMAVQFHVAHSAMVKGAGVIAGGPYFCAQDSFDTATGTCSCTGFGSCPAGQAGQGVPRLE